MIVYAIRHKPTKEFMPARMNKSGQGWSHWTPGDAEDPPYDSNPRVFYNPHSARNALTMWLQGKWERNSGTSYDWEGTPDSYDHMRVNAPTVPRLRAEMEIVTFSLQEVPAPAIS